MRVLAVATLSILALSACGSDSDPLTEGWSGGIPDGAYRCTAEQGGVTSTVGDIQIEGVRYGGLSTGLQGAYSVADDGSVEFSEGFDGIPEGFDVARATWTTNPSPTLAIMLASPSGSEMTLTCTPAPDIPA